MSPPYSGPAPRTVKRHSAIVTSSTKKPGSLLPGSSGYAVDDLAHSFIIHRTSGSPASHHLTAQPHRKSALPAWEMDEEEDVELVREPLIRKNLQPRSKPDIFGE